MDLNSMKNVLSEHLSKSTERQITVQSSGLAAAAMLAAYAYGRASYVPASTRCPPYNKFTTFDASRCTEVPAVIAYPEHWLSLLVWGSVGTIMFGAIASALDRSVFTRYLLSGWLAFCAIISISGYLTYSSIGRFPGAYLLVYPATTVVSFGVAAACIAAVANVVLRLRWASTAS